MGFDFLKNYTNNPESILKKTRAMLKKVSIENSEVSQTKRNLAPEFEAMANKTLHEFFASIKENIRTGPQVNIGEDGFELKPALITMVQASQFCGKAHEDASAHLQHFLVICSTFTIKGVTRDAILLRLFPFSLLGKAKQWFYINKESHTTWDHCSTAFLAKFFPIGKTNALREKFASFQHDESVTKD
jgi:hypothetical protein